MNPANKRLYIITTRSLNKSGFLKDSICEKKNVNADSPVMQFLIGDINEALVSWIFALSENQDNEHLPQVLERLGINDLSQIGDPYYLMSFITEDKKNVILHQFGHNFTEFERSNLESPVTDFCSASYLERESDNVRIIALPHLPPGRNSCFEDNRCWTNALIDTFAKDGEDIRLVLHDKDIYGYNDYAMGLQEKERVLKIVGRDDVELFLFQHNGGSIDRCISIADYQGGINELERVFNKWISDRESNSIL